MTPSSSSLARRALLAAFLLVGFYVLALAISGGLLWLVYARAALDVRVPAKLLVFAVIGAAVILWSILPRWDRFEAPGPRLEPGEQPRLFEAIRGIAGGMKQEMPAEVYLVPEVNAWVMERGGLMGIGSRRVMGLGLPLMQMLTRGELAGVLAHEFGHFYGGDTKLGPWLYKTRAAIGRTLENLGEGWAILQAPFRWYGNMFLRITHAVSREQEFTADRLAAELVGPKPLIEGLRKVNARGGSFEAFWHSEVAPVVSAGFLPPIAEGFRLFSDTPFVRGQAESQLEQALAGADADPLDTHPPLPQRIAALERVATTSSLADEEGSAVSLLSSLDELEVRLLSHATGNESFGKLPRVAWEDVTSKVILPQWQSATSANAQALAGLTAADLPSAASRLHELATKLADAPVHGEGRVEFAKQVLGIAFGVALHHAGWTMTAPLAEPVQLVHGDERLNPIKIVFELAEGTRTAEAWRAECERLEIAGLKLVE